ncbi:hypothetical protein DUNSADRAFT_10350 [Dunaliella salina]|uniref:Uncharacterized protein n=1 Tax=Dunaliella salina TaxID=3046 RepID=A0ABQ7H4X6_DUNSA|nr:hypothetical protein DUNSADRAFT_10350 [Dunaliella salina]|eukprot:KAF5841913.1 hypothetical protein DUNSADRAFT_10350 [Dunaliella salina]
MLKHCSRLAFFFQTISHQPSHASCCAASLSHSACKLTCASGSLGSPSSTTYHSLSHRQPLKNNTDQLPSVWQQWRAGNNRGFSDAPGYNEEVEAINSLFVEARDEIEMAHEESETVYFDESVKSAKEVVEACISKWEALLKSLPEDERAKLQRSMGLRMEQLKAEFDTVKNLHLEE